MELEIVPFRPDIGPPKYANCLFSSNFESEMLHLSSLNRKWAPTIGEGGEISPLLPPPPGCATGRELVWGSDRATRWRLLGCEPLLLV